MFAGIDAKSEAINLCVEKGIINKNPNKNIHFITVRGLYFIIRGLTITRYRAKEEALIRIKTFPTKVAELNEIFPLLKIKYIAPPAPRIMPVILNKEIFSFKIKYENTNTKTGFIVIIIEEFMGVVRFKPSKKMV